MALITISRQFGAGGLTLGRAVATKLGYTLLLLIADRNYRVRFMESEYKK
jgi:hypothetical protein